MTFAKHVRDKFIFFACYKVLPSAPVFDTFSDPAKSTINRLLVLACWVSELNWLSVNWKIKWDLEEFAFILVTQVTLFFWAKLMSLLSSNLSEI